MRASSLTPIQASSIPDVLPVELSVILACLSKHHVTLGPNITEKTTIYHSITSFVVITPSGIETSILNMRVHDKSREEPCW